MYLLGHNSCKLLEQSNTTEIIEKLILNLNLNLSLNLNLNLNLPEPQPEPQPGHQHLTGNGNYDHRGHHGLSMAWSGVSSSMHHNAIIVVIKPILDI